MEKSGKGISKERQKKIRRILNQTCFFRYLQLFCGVCLLAFGIGLLIVGILQKLFTDATTFIFFLIFLIAFWASGIFFTVTALRQLIPYYMDLYVLKHGEIGTAILIGHRFVTVSRRGGRSNIPTHCRKYYSVTLRFTADGVVCKTGYYYSADQFKRLSGMREIETVQLNGRAVIVEDLPEEGLKQKDLPKRLQRQNAAVIIFTVVSLALIAMAIFISATLKNTVLALIFLSIGSVTLIVCAICKAILLDKISRLKKK